MRRPSVRGSAASSGDPLRNAPRRTRKRPSPTPLTARCSTYTRTRRSGLRERFRKEGFDPDNDSTDPNTPEGVGNAAAHALIEFRRNDGSNQDGAMKGGDGTPYSDYTGYKPKNTADHFADKIGLVPHPLFRREGRVVLAGLSPPAMFQGHSLRAGEHRPVPARTAAAVRLRTAGARGGGSDAGEREPHPRAEGRRGIHARGPALHRTIRALAAVRAGRVAARPPRPGPGHEAVLLGGERRLRRLHGLLGGQALLRHGPPLLVGAPIPRRRDRGRLAGSGQGLREGEGGRSGTLIRPTSS